MVALDGELCGLITEMDSKSLKRALTQLHSECLKLYGVSTILSAIILWSFDCSECCRVKLGTARQIDVVAVQANHSTTIYLQEPDIYMYSRTSMARTPLGP